MEGWRDVYSESGAEGGIRGGRSQEGDVHRKRRQAENFYKLILPAQQSASPANRGMQSSLSQGML
eukprot:717901-Pyramimonas_sp.AAC.1